jgi:uncharacterized LabA/DUF88 family protein
VGKAYRGLPAGGKKKIAVLVDFENVLRVGHETFTRSQDRLAHVPHPRKLAEAIAAMRRSQCEIGAVRVYRGHPDPAIEAWAAKLDDMMAAHWQDAGVTMVSLPLQYIGGQAREKGIDMALGTDLQSLAGTALYDTLVVFSHDADLLPAIERTRQLGMHVETASWHTARTSLAAKGHWNHQLDLPAFKACSEDWTAQGKGIPFYRTGTNLGGVLSNSLAQRPRDTAQQEQTSQVNIEPAEVRARKTRVVLSHEDREALRADYAAGIPVPGLAAKYNQSDSNARRIATEAATRPPAQPTRLHSVPANPKPDLRNDEFVVPADLQQDAAWVAAFLGMSVAEVVHIALREWVDPKMSKIQELRRELIA